MDEIRDGSVESKLDSKAAQVFGDFSLIFVAQTIGMQLVNFVELSLSVPFVGQLKERLFLKILAIFSDVSDVSGGFL